MIIYLWTFEETDIHSFFFYILCPPKTLEDGSLHLFLCLVANLLTIFVSVALVFGVGYIES